MKMPVLRATLSRDGLGQRGAGVRARPGAWRAAPPTPRSPTCSASRRSTRATATTASPRASTARRAARPSPVDAETARAPRLRASAATSSPAGSSTSPQACCGAPGISGTQPPRLPDATSARRRARADRLGRRRTGRRARAAAARRHGDRLRRHRQGIRGRSRGDDSAGRGRQRTRSSISAGDVRALGTQPDGAPWRVGDPASAARARGHRLRRAWPAARSRPAATTSAISTSTGAATATSSIRGRACPSRTGNRSAWWRRCASSPEAARRSRCCWRRRGEAFLAAQGVHYIAVGPDGTRAGDAAPA